MNVNAFYQLLHTNRGTHILNVHPLYIFSCNYYIIRIEFIAVMWILNKVKQKSLVLFMPIKKTHCCDVKTDTCRRIFGPCDKEVSRATTTRNNNFVVECMHKFRLCHRMSRAHIAIWQKFNPSPEMRVNFLPLLYARLLPSVHKHI